jgi:outer membrane biogenesis lipoprotein LolB
MRHAIPATVVLLLAGCAGQQVAQQVPAEPVVADNFCETAKKRSWSVKDTARTIADARAWNRAVDKRCGTAGG